MKKNKIQLKSFRLDIQTIAQLNEEQMGEIAGGQEPVVMTSCNAFSCNPDNCNATATGTPEE